MERLSRLWCIKKPVLLLCRIMAVEYRLRILRSKNYKLMCECADVQMCGF